MRCYALILLREFLDEFYGRVRRGVAAALIADEPPRLPDVKEHASLGATVNIWPAGGTCPFRRGRKALRGFSVVRISRRQLKDLRRCSSLRALSPFVAV